LAITGLTSRAIDVVGAAFGRERAAANLFTAKGRSYGCHALSLRSFGLLRDGGAWRKRKRPPLVGGLRGCAANPPYIRWETDLEYQVNIQGKIAVVMLTGDIDLYYTPDARRIILRCLTEKHGVLVDLSGVTYIDSSGIACLVEGYQSAKQQQLRFGLIGVSENAMNVLRLTRLDQVFPVHDSLAAALQNGG